MYAISLVSFEMIMTRPYGVVASAAVSVFYKNPVRRVYSGRVLIIMITAKWGLHVIDLFAHESRI